MKNPEHARHFSDVDVSQFGFGGLGGEGADMHQKTTARPARDGVKISLSCDNCGAPNILTVEWPEAVVISSGNLPPGWKLDGGYVRPEVGCASCRRLVTPGMTPSEAKRWVEAGINARFVSPQEANAIIQRVARGRMS